jgi:hypothetical protein
MTSQHELMAVLYHLVGLRRKGQHPVSVSHMFRGPGGSEALARMPTMFVEDLDHLNDEPLFWQRGVITSAGRRAVVDITLRIQEGTYGALPATKHGLALPFELCHLP